MCADLSSASANKLDEKKWLVIFFSETRNKFFFGHRPSALQKFFYSRSSSLRLQMSKDAKKPTKYALSLSNPDWTFTPKACITSTAHETRRSQLRSGHGEKMADLLKDTMFNPEADIIVAVNKESGKIEWGVPFGLSDAKLAAGHICCIPASSWMNASFVMNYIKKLQPDEKRAITAQTLLHGHQLGEIAALILNKRSADKIDTVAAPAKRVRKQEPAAAAENGSADLDMQLANLVGPMRPELSETCLAKTALENHIGSMTLAQLAEKNARKFVLANNTQAIDEMAKAMPPEKRELSEWSKVFDDTTARVETSAAGKQCVFAFCSVVLKCQAEVDKQHKEACRIIDSLALQLEESQQKCQKLGQEAMQLADENVRLKQKVEALPNGQVPVVASSSGKSAICFDDD